MEALADGTRRAIVDRLARTDLSVNEIAEGLPVTRPAVSQHLAVLRAAGLVIDRREGTRRIYRLRPDGFDELRRYVEGLWDRALGSFAAAVEREEEPSMETNEIEPVRRSVTVGASVDRAFEVFTNGLGTWWPLEHHSVSVGGGEDDAAAAPPQTAVLEPRVGGRVFERLADGTEHDWGRVLVWEPPTRLVLAWQPNRDPQAPTEVEVRFIAEADGGTRVELEHRGWERLGADAERARESYAGGWPGVLERFAAAADA